MKMYKVVEGELQTCIVDKDQVASMKSVDWLTEKPQKKSTEPSSDQRSSASTAPAK